MGSERGVMTMKYKYEEITTVDKAVFIKRTDTNGQECYIPTDPANSDYQRYLRWLENPDAEEGGTL
jgi:hypothetical protein